MTERSASLENQWEFGPAVPTCDFFEHRDVRIVGELEWLLNDLVYALERDDFLQWEAVVCQELGLPLTECQRRAVSDLLNFTDETDEDRILYIDGMPRPDRLWYETVRTVAPHLLLQQFKTLDLHYAVTTEGWKDLVAALEAHGEGLSLPEGVERPVEVVPAELRHRLWLQTCFEALSGLGQEEELTLREPEQQVRVVEFIDNLRRCKESIEFLRLTLDRLLKVLVLPTQDEPIFIELMKKELGLGSMDEPIAGHL